MMATDLIQLPMISVPCSMEADSKNSGLLLCHNVLRNNIYISIEHVQKEFTKQLIICKMNSSLINYIKLMYCVFVNMFGQAL